MRKENNKVRELFTQGDEIHANLENWFKSFTMCLKLTAQIFVAKSFPRGTFGTGLSNFVRKFIDKVTSASAMRVS